MLYATGLNGEETEVDDVRLSPDENRSSREKWKQESEQQVTVKDGEAAAETGTTLEDSIKRQQDLPGYHDASPAQSSDGISDSEDEMTNVIDKSSVEKDTVERGINYLKLGPGKFQEKIRQFEQQVQKGLDEAAQHQERADSAVAELLDAKKEVDAMKDEVAEANDKVSELTDRVQSQRGIIASLKSGILQIDSKKGSVFLRVHIRALEAVLSEDRVSQEEDGSSPKIEQESPPVSPSEVLLNTYARKPACRCFEDYVVDADSSSADSSTTTSEVIWFSTEEALTAAQSEISERSEDSFEDVELNENESELSELKSLSELLSAPAQSPRSVVLKEFSEKKLPTGTLSQDLILEAAMKKQTTWTGLGGFFS
jgi:hypothetical protein